MCCFQTPVAALEVHMEACSGVCEHLQELLKRLNVNIQRWEEHQDSANLQIDALRHQSMLTQTQTQAPVLSTASVRKLTVELHTARSSLQVLEETSWSEAGRVAVERMRLCTNNMDTLLAELSNAIWLPQNGMQSVRL